MTDFWIERQSGQSMLLNDWRREWREAVYFDELDQHSWPDSWPLFLRTCLTPDNGKLATIRKRRPGGGRKPAPDKMVIRQICLARDQAEAVKQAAAAAGVSQSAWIREAIRKQLARQPDTNPGSRAKVNSSRAKMTGLEYPETW